MGGPTSVQPVARALAAGLAGASPARCGITVTLTPGAGDGALSLETWPRHMRDLRANLRLRVAEPDGSRTDAIGPRLVGPIPLLDTPGLRADPHGAETLNSIVNLWRRAMAPAPAIMLGDPWSALRKVIEGTAAPAPERHARRVVATPVPLAAVAYPVERGRALLDGLAAPDGALAGRAPVRLPAAAPAEVPSSRSTPDTAPGPRWMSPPRIARAALGRDGSLDGVFRQVHAAHAEATPPSGAALEDDGTQGAGRRLASLHGAPVLQRLFGLAADFEVDLSSLPGGIPPLGRFLLLAVDGTGGPLVWTLAKLRLASAGQPGHFGPATWAERDWAQGRGERPVGEEGLEILDRVVGADPAYDLSTVDAELSAEADVGIQRRRDSGELGRGPHGTLRSGGLRLVDRARLDGAARQALASAAATADHAAFLAGANVVQDADALHPLGRLDLGLDASTGPAWRCAMNRVVRYEDPAPGSAPRDWVETELERLLGPANGLRRLELDGASVSAAVITADAPDGKVQRNPFFDQLPRGEMDKRQAALDRDHQADDAADKQAADVAESTVASWGGEPMGAPVQDHDEDTLDDLGVSRTVTLPSSATGDPAEALIIPMRFGWPYRVGLRKVYPGGVCLPLQTAAARYSAEGSHACLPPQGTGATASAGRRLLRHERIEAPGLALPAADAGAPAGRYGPQGAQHAILRTEPGRPRPTAVRRILAAPGVPLQFATLHDALRGRRPGRGVRRGQPEPGLLDGMLWSAPGLPTVFEAGRRAAEADVPYYPDPAASLMVLALRRPSAPDGWLDETVVVPLGDAWPDLPAVLVELDASAASTASRLALVGEGSLGSGERFQRGTPRGSGRGTAPAFLVRASLSPGEDLALDAWCVPTVAQLVTWFDAVESAGVLVAYEAATTDQTCAQALQALLGLPVDMPAALERSCVGAGGLPAPSPRALRPLAAAIHQEMLRRPNPVIAAVQNLRLTHAVRGPHVAPSLQSGGDGRLAVTRRLFAGGDARPSRQPGEPAPIGETRHDFVGSVRTSDWGPATSEEGALLALFGGTIEADPVTTIAVELHVTCADPHSDLLDDHEHRGRSAAQQAGADWRHVEVEDRFMKLFGFRVARDRSVSLPQRPQVLLRVDGLPVPDDGRPGPRRFALEALQAATWRPAGAGETTGSTPDGGALRCAVGNAFGTLGARLLTVTPVALGRHAGLFKEVHAPARDEDVDAALRGDPVQVWLPATRRPSPPEVRRVDVRLAQVRHVSAEVAGARTVSLEQRTRIRIELARPWFSSGEGERLGLVLWPPNLFALGTSADEAGVTLPKELLDADIGRGGSYVTRWAEESQDAVGAELTPLVPADALALPDQDPEAAIRTAFMPLPAAADGSLADPKAPPEFMAVALLTTEPRFDVERERWFVDVDLKKGSGSDPYLRLGLVRYQPHAREDLTARDAGGPVRLRVSTPVTARAKVLASRRAEATWRRLPDGSTEVLVTVRVSRPKGADGFGPACDVELLRRRRVDGAPTKAIGLDGEPCVWTGTSDFGAIRQGGGTSWTCRFVMREPPEDERWTTMVWVRSFARRPSGSSDARPTPVAGGEGSQDSGDDFLGVLHLTADPSSTADQAEARPRRA